MSKFLTGKNFLALGNIETSDCPQEIKDVYKQLKTKSLLIMPIKKEDEVWGMLGVFQYNYQRSWNKEEVELLETIASQIYIAIKQAELYSFAKKQAEKEKILRNIITLIRKSLNINEIKREIVQQVGKYFNADRVFVMEYDNNKNKLLPVDENSEYLSSEDIKSIKGLDVIKAKIKCFLDISKLKQEVIIEDIDKYIKENKEEGTTTEDFYVNYGVKTCIGLPIYICDVISGLIVVHNTKKAYHFSQEDIDFLRTVSNQAGIAFHHATLYMQMKNKAKDEAILKTIIGRIKLSQSIDEIYNYTLRELTLIFNTSRAIFAYIPSYKYQQPYIKQEYLKDKKLKSIKGVKVPDFCLQIFKEIISNENLFIVKNIQEYYKNNTEALAFFKTYSIKAIIAAPLTKDSKEKQILGVLVTCSDQERDWTESQIKLFTSIKQTVLNCVWENARMEEIEKLRETFLSTLAHDLQVPLIAQQKALEFLLSRADNKTIGELRGFIKETRDSNKNLFNLLTKILESYYYESGKKLLFKQKQKLASCIYEVKEELQDFADLKTVEININIDKKLPSIPFDRDQIKIAIYNILENAIKYTRQKDRIFIKNYRVENDLLLCVSDTGPGIPEEIRTRIFERYAMVQSIERKIGTGLGLYIAKQIVEAHNGKIWYESVPGEGSIFCFLLPIQD